MVKAGEEFRYALVMKFMRTRPSIDKIWLTVVKAWGLMEIPTISFMDDHHMLIHMKTNVILCMDGQGKVELWKAIFFGCSNEQRSLM